MVTEQETEDLARVAYAAYAKAEGCALSWESATPRRQETLGLIAAAVRDAVLAQVVPSTVIVYSPMPTETVCAHNWHVVDYWRDLGSVVWGCTRCRQLVRDEVPR